MIRPLTALAGLAVVAAAVFIVAVPQWTHPPHNGVELAPQPQQMIQWSRGEMPEPVPQVPPPALPAVAQDGPTAGATYKNVQVLGDISAAEFMRLQEAITQWVAPTQGCGFCHVGTDFQSDAKPQKQTARLMLQMVRHINADWHEHVGEAGVTCFTCHRGQPIPADVWFPSQPRSAPSLVAKQDRWREDADNVRKFFPDAGYDLYLLDDQPISVQSVTALPSQTVAAPIVAARIYEMMMQMSDGMGVNCGYCHNSRAMADWSQSTPHRWQGESGLQLTRDLNRNFLLKLAALLPETRERIEDTRLPSLPKQDYGVQTGNAMVLCATCHEARPKPMNGQSTLAAYPELIGTPQLPARQETRR